MTLSPAPPSAGPRGPGKVFYGWKIVGVAFVVDFIAVGFFFYSYGVFLKPIADEFGGSRFLASLGVPAANVMGALVAPFVGRALDRHSIKRIMVGGTLAVSAGFFLLSRITELWQFFAILSIFVGLGMACMGGIASSKLVANWFIERRGTALGRATVGVSLSGLVMPGIATWLVAHTGWRGGFLVYAVAMLAIVVPVVLRYVVNRPEDVGLRPDGARPWVDGDPEPPPERMWRTREIVASRNFWCIALAFALVMAALSAILIHVVPYADDLGLSSSRAASILSAAAGAGVLGKLAFGWLVDRLDPRIAVWISFGGQIAGVLLLMHGTTYPELLAAGATFGFAMGGVIPLQGTVVGSAFGRLSFGKVVGLMRPVQVPIHAVGIPLAGFIHDATKSYEVAFWVYLGVYVLAGVVIGLLSLDPRRVAAPAPAPASGRETGLA